MWDWIVRNRLAAAAFLVAAVYYPGILSGAYSPRWWVVAIALPIASDLDPRIIYRPVLVLLLGGLAWAAMSLLVTPDPQGAALDLLFLALLTLTAIAAAGIDDIAPVIVAFGWGVSISCVLAIPQSFGWSAINQILGPAGTFMNSEVLAELAAPLLAWCIFKKRWALASMMAIPLVLCHSRIAILAAAVGLLVGWRASALIKSALAAALVLVAIGSVSMVGIDKASSGLTRMILWISGIDSIVPLGRGLGWWAFVHPASFQELAHSDALQMMVELGIGSVFFLAIPVVIILRRRGSDSAEHAISAAFLFEFVVSFPLHVPASGFLVAMLAGHMAGSRTCLRGRESIRGIVLFPDVPRGDSFAGGVAGGLGGRAEDVSFRPPSPQHCALNSKAGGRF